MLLGVNICEDIWYAVGPTNAQSLAGAELIVNINASPFSEQKPAFRKKMLATRASDNHAIVAYVNMVGGQDELVFDGSSLVFDPGGELLCQGRAFEEDLLVVDLDVAGVSRERLHDPRRRKSHLLREVDQPAQVIEIASSRPRALTRPALPARSPRGRSQLGGGDVRALVLGTRDYVCKTGFRQVVLGLSGGIDSSLVAVIAADALGPENVLGVSMPSRYSSQGSTDDASELVEALGIRYQTVPIEGPFRAMLDALSEVFRGQQPDTTEEEPAGPYPRTDLDGHLEQVRLDGVDDGQQERDGHWLRDPVWRHGRRLRGHQRRAQDARVRAEAATATEPRAATRSSPKTCSPNHRRPSCGRTRPTRDSLPPYDELDAILVAYVEEDRSLDEIVRQGFSSDLVRRVVSWSTATSTSEGRRRQVKVSPRAHLAAIGGCQ